MRVDRDLRKSFKKQLEQVSKNLRSIRAQQVLHKNAHIDLETIVQSKILKNPQIEDNIAIQWNE